MDCNQSQFLLVPLLDGAEWESTLLSLKTVLEKLLTDKFSSSLFSTTAVSVRMNLSETCSWKNISVHCWHGQHFSFEIKCFLYKDNLKAAQIEIKKSIYSIVPQVQAPRIYKNVLLSIINNKSVITLKSLLLKEYILKTNRNTCKQSIIPESLVGI